MKYIVVLAESLMLFGAEAKEYLFGISLLWAQSTFGPKLSTISTFYSVTIVKISTFEGGECFVSQ